MRIRIPGYMLATSIVAIALTATAGAAAARAQPMATDQVAGARSSQVDPITDHIARLLARTLDEPAVRHHIGTAVVAGPVDVLALEPGSSFASAARGANQALLAAKGLPATVGSILQVQLAHPDMAAAVARGESLLVVGATSDDAVTNVTAYHTGGASVLLDATRLPDRPVLVIDVNVAKAMSVGLDMVRNQLAMAGLAGRKSAADGQVSGDLSTMTSSYYATRIDRVRLNDDHEPWIKSGAEIFSIVGGFGLDGRPTIDIVDMPYLDHDGRDYYPNQVLIHWQPDRYLYNFADVVMMEDDGGTNYSNLASALINALATISGLGGYVPLVNSIIQAIPGDWWTDDPDYVDSWYTLSTYSTGGRWGAGGNGLFTLSLIVIDPLYSPPPIPDCAYDWPPCPY